MSFRCKNLIRFDLNLEMFAKNKTAYLGACVCYGFQNTHVKRLNVLGRIPNETKTKNKFFPVPVPFTSDVDEMIIGLQDLNKKALQRRKMTRHLAPLLLTPCRTMLDPETITLSCLTHKTFLLTGGYVCNFKNTQHMVTTFLHPTKTNTLSCLIMSHIVDVTEVAYRMLEFNSGANPSSSIIAQL